MLEGSTAVDLDNEHTTLIVKDTFTHHRVGDQSTPLEA